jgi:hypothetical protein
VGARSLRPGSLKRLRELRREYGREAEPFEVHVISLDAYSVDGLRHEDLASEAADPGASHGVGHPGLDDRGRVIGASALHRAHAAAGHPELDDEAVLGSHVTPADMEAAWPER